MSVTKAQKEAVVALLTEKLADKPSVYVTDYKGLNVEEVSQLRQILREAGVEYRVVKNTLLKRAMENTGGYDEAFDYLNGPTAVAISVQPNAAAKAIKVFRKKSNQSLPELKAAIVDGALFKGNQLDELATLKGKEELLGEVVTLLLSPIQNVASAIESQGSNLLAILESLQNRVEA
ncbi:MAG: 50S ribosomal protein L10 [Bacteroidetes bacterium]|nr:50S ribosomal protein L10 [Bacteroidota bacterium]MCY4205961.1 50S ribosomal protein L10 [Bacteroidota bacterium]